MSVKSKLLALYRTPFGQYSFRLLPDSLFIRIQYKAIMGKTLHLRNPRSFNEKLQWLKLHDRKKEYEVYVDKYSARAFVTQVIGEEYLVKLLGVWENAEDINYDNLPEKFVIKGAHDSGSVVVCRDKSTLDKKDTTEKMKYTLKKNNFYYGRDWPYKHVKPRIIAEEYLDNGPLGLVDYKFYCFNGEPRFLYISQGLENHSTASITFYDLNGKRMPFQRADYPTHKVDPKLPDNFKEMVVIAKKLSEAVSAPFIRIDLYNINGRIVFSEITFRPCSGYMKFVPEEWDYKVGDMLVL